VSYIELNNVSIGFGSGSARTEVLTDLNLHVQKKELIAIVGYSGTGKSTFMNLIAGLLKPDKGEVIVDGKKVDGPHPDRGLVFQNYSLLPWLNVYNNVGVAVKKVFANESKDTQGNRITDSIDLVNLTDAAHKKPGELSGGMRQRNSVARTLSMSPNILLLDEPLSALDALTRSVIQDQILEIKEKLGQTVILITNDVDEGLYMADRIIPLSIGPGATFGPEFNVDKPFPRDRKEINMAPDYLKLRTQIVTYLLSEKEKERARSTTKPVSLPNIRPMDLSKHKPSWFLGLRPKKRKQLASSK
jgi:nitrate/nitrite transport system ATP-binding protein